MKQSEQDYLKSIMQQVEEYDYKQVIEQSIREQ